MTCLTRKSVVAAIMARAALRPAPTSRTLLGSSWRVMSVTTRWRSWDVDVAAQVEELPRDGLSDVGVAWLVGQEDNAWGAVLQGEMPAQAVPGTIA